MITREQIARFAPGAKPELVEAILDNWEVAQAAGIENARKPTRLHDFMASIAVETGGLKSVSENLNYTSAQRIYDVFKGPKSKPRFANVKACEPYVRQPKKLAIKVYGGRLGNAPAPSEDSWIYRGAGMLQTTGRTNFKALGFEDNPDALRDPTIAFKTAVTEWLRRNCNQLSDAGDRTAVRKAINGGTNGLSEFLAYCTKAEKVWPTVDGGRRAVEPDELDRAYQRVDDSEEVPVPRPREERPPGVFTDAITVARVQQKLYDLGYTEVGSKRTDGSFDGTLGKLTRGAIAIFRLEHDLPVGDTIDGEFLAALDSAEPRELGDRSEASTKEVAEKVPEVKASLLSRAWAWWIGGGAATVGVASAGGEADPDKKGLLKQVLGIIETVPGWMWCLLVVIGVGVIVYLNHKSAKEGVQAFRDGARR